MLNPHLELNQVVKHQDGRIGVISDVANHRKSRLVSLFDSSSLEKWPVSKIAAFKVSGEWIDCTWK